MVIPMMRGRIWTIGHSTRPIDDFIHLLSAQGIEKLVDIRLIPFSRRHPQFHTAALAAALRDAGMMYEHLAVLGGRRHSHPDSPNTGWRNASFRGYADYMATEAFLQGLAQLMASAATLRTGIMCAEAVPWRCHRTLVADALVHRGWEVVHIMGRTRADRHVLTAFAKVTDDRLFYPASHPLPFD